jgi:hypothetical protein
MSRKPPTHPNDVLQAVSSESGGVAPNDFPFCIQYSVFCIVCCRRLATANGRRSATLDTEY